MGRDAETDVDKVFHMAIIEAAIHKKFVVEKLANVIFAKYLPKRRAAAITEWHAYNMACESFRQTSLVKQKCVCRVSVVCP